MLSKSALNNLRRFSTTFESQGQAFTNRWRNCIHGDKVTGMDLNKSVNLEALKSQINGETTKNFWMRGYAVFHEVFDSETVNVLKDEMKHYTE